MPDVSQYTTEEMIEDYRFFAKAIKDAQDEINNGLFKDRFSTMMQQGRIVDAENCMKVIEGELSKRGVEIPKTEEEIDESNNNS